MAYDNFLRNSQGGTAFRTPQPPAWQPMPLEEILAGSTPERPDTPPPGGVVYQGFVFRNPKVIANLRRLEDALRQLGINNFRVSGGDRYIDSRGNHRSATNNEIVSDSRSHSPHLIENGARAADVVVLGVTEALFKQAVAMTEFIPQNTKVYSDHFHVALFHSTANNAPR